MLDFRLSVNLSDAFESIHRCSLDVVNTPLIRLCLLDTDMHPFLHAVELVT